MQPSFVSPPIPDRGRSLGSLVGAALRRPGGRRVVSVLSLVLFLAGGTMFAFPLGTDLFGGIQQSRLSSGFTAPTVQQAYRERRVPVGDGLTRLTIDKIGVDVVVVQGTTQAALRAGSGHYVDTPLPGEQGNVGIAGHRTTYGRPFNRLDELKPGDLARLQTPLGSYTYRAVAPFDGHLNPWVVLPTDVSVVAPAAGAHELTLTTCNPKGSARQRLVMRFALISPAADGASAGAPVAALAAPPA